MAKKQFYSPDRVRAGFWNRVLRNGTGCWDWLGKRYPSGYGRAWFNGKTSYAHRVAFQLTQGDIPLGLCVLHRCGGRSCVNPDHLYIGTKLDNARDKRRHGTQFYGETHPKAKLTDAKVRRLRHLYLQHHIGQGTLARIFRVSRWAVWCIVKGKTWRHLLLRKEEETWNHET